jgi:hypothetical protein
MKNRFAARVGQCDSLPRGSMLSKTKKWLRIFLLTLATAVALLAAFVCYELFIEPLPNTRERALISSIQAHLKEPGAWAMVSDIHPGNWNQVCLIPSMSIGGAQNMQTIRSTFQIEEPQINLPNGIASSSDWNWTVMFFYPPNMVETFEIPNAPLYGEGVQYKEGASHICRTREEAVFILTDTVFDKTQAGIRLTTLQQLKGEHR